MFNIEKFECREIKCTNRLRNTVLLKPVYNADKVIRLLDPTLVSWTMKRNRKTKEIALMYYKGEDDFRKELDYNHNILLGRVYNIM